MADSKRLAILKALTSLIESVSTTGDQYQHDLLDKVFRGRGTISDTEPLPSVNILESLNPDREPIEIGGFTARKQTDNWVLLIQGWSKDDKQNPTDPAHLLMGDVKKVLARIVDMDDPLYLLGGLIVDAAIEPGTVRPPDENSSRAYFWLRIVLKVSENMSDPFAL